MLYCAISLQNFLKSHFKICFKSFFFFLQTWHLYFEYSIIFHYLALIPWFLFSSIWVEFLNDYMPSCILRIFSWNFVEFLFDFYHFLSNWSLIFIWFLRLDQAKLIYLLVIFLFEIIYSYMRIGLNWIRSYFITLNLWFSTSIFVFLGLTFFNSKLIISCLLKSHFFIGIKCVKIEFLPIFELHF